MSGKKTVLVFLLLTVLTGVVLGVLIKQGYENRPKVTIPNP